MIFLGRSFGLFESSKMKKSLLDKIVITTQAIAIGVPLGLVALQPVCYFGIYNRLTKIERVAPILARDLAKDLASSNKTVLDRTLKYGIKRAAIRYLKNFPEDD